MRRREFIAGLGGAAVWPLAAFAQQGERVRRIGVLNHNGSSPGSAGVVPAVELPRPIDETPNREPPSTRRGVPSMDDYESLSHTKWECKYHVVFIPKCRRKTLYAELRRHLGEVFRKLAEQKESRIEEGHLLPDHVHMLISIPPKHSVAQVIGFIKGKSAIHLARVYGEKKRNFVGQHFWARGYLVSTVGRDTEVIREYIRKQEEEDKRLEQLNLWR